MRQDATIGRPRLGDGSPVSILRLFFEFNPKDYEKRAGRDYRRLSHEFEVLSALLLWDGSGIQQTSVNVREVLGKKTEKTRR